jgi:hypothetical protein
MWTLPARGLVVLAAFLLVAIRSAEADSLLLPPVGAPGFKALCTDMYEKRDTPEGWPVQFQGSAHHCTLKTHAGTSTDMTEDDYAWSLRKSLTFACKGKREVFSKSCAGSGTAMGKAAPSKCCRTRQRRVHAGCRF